MSEKVKAPAKNFNNVFPDNPGAGAPPAKKAKIPGMETPASSANESAGEEERQSSALPVTEPQKEISQEDLDKVKSLQIQKEESEVLLKLANSKVSWTIRTKKMVQTHFNRICYHDNLTHGGLMAIFLRDYYDKYHGGKRFEKIPKRKEEDDFDISDIEKMFE